MAKLTPEASRAARAILKWSMRDLAETAGVALATIYALESKGDPIRASTEAKLVEAFDAHGVEITNGNGTGARLRLQNPAAYTAANGLPALAKALWRVAPSRIAAGMFEATRDPPGVHAPLYPSRAEMEMWLKVYGCEQTDADPDLWREK